jgi:ABC-type branched-subunit amino acid transport system substrate-binding protein
VAVVGVLTLLAACGSRLTPAQVAALNGPVGGSVPASGNAGPAPGAASDVTSPLPAGGSSISQAAGGSTGGAAPGAVQPGPAGPTPGVPVGGGSQGSGSGSGSGVAINSAVCNGPASGPGISANEIDIGNVSTLTGPVPGLFIGAQHGINAFAAYINSIGGICGRRLVVKSADDNLDVSQNATATQSLAGSILAFVGSFSGDDQGGAAVLQADGVPDIGESLSSQRFGLANNFSPEPRPAGWNTAPYIYFKQRFPAAASHMAVLTENQATAVTETQAQVKALESIGYTFVYQDNGLEPTQTDFSADAQAMKAKGALGVIFLAPASFYANLAKAIQNAGLKLPLANYSSTAYDPAFTTEGGDAANGAIFVQEEAMYEGEDATSVPMVALFDKWYKALYGGQPDEYADYAWMSGLLFIDGLNRGGGLNRASLLSGLKQVTDFTAGGLVADNNPAGKKPPFCYLIVDVVNDRFIRDPADPPSGFDCTNAPHFYYLP